ncbi:unnamed protein product [Trichobilharzia regenti]|nr:unnamed protein product [Trichobilharzia regenti]
MEQPRLLFIIAMYNYTLHIPQGVPDLFVQLFKDCWSPTPTSRPTFENIIARLESCKDCSFVDLEPSELAQIQQGWRELIAAHHNEEQQSVAEALSSSFKSGSLDFTSELLTQLELLRNYRESLDRVKADLVERAHQLHMKEELYNRMAGTMGVSFSLLTFFIKFIAANIKKVYFHRNCITPTYNLISSICTFCIWTTIFMYAKFNFDYIRIIEQFRQHCHLSHKNIITNIL